MGGGGKALVAWPLVDELFFAASLMNTERREYFVNWAWENSVI